jgi:hypothetical protein
MLEKRGWPKKDIHDFVLATLAREYNIGVQSYIQKTLGLRFSPPGKEYESPEERRERLEEEGFDIEGGGAGSGCHGPHCGRPKTRNSAEVLMHRAGIKKELEEVNRRLSIQRGQKGYVRKKQRAGLKLVKQGLKVQLRYYGKKDRLLPGMKRIGRLHTIPVQPVPKGQVKKQWVSQEGYKVTEIKSPKQYEAKGGSKDWLRKPDLYKGRYVVDVAEHRTIDDQNERNKFFIHTEGDDRSRSIEVHRNFGDKHVTVIQRDLGQYDSIANHKEVTFKNIGTAMGFMNKRYGITFKLA